MPRYNEIDSNKTDAKYMNATIDDKWWSIYHRPFQVAKRAQFYSTDLGLQKVLESYPSSTKAIMVDLYSQSTIGQGQHFHY
jgi:hypothetical protein